MTKLLYFVSTLGFIYQSKEFSGAGLSPEAFLSYNDWIGSEELRFFNYHMKRTAGSMVIHSLLPAGILVLLLYSVLYLIPRIFAWIQLLHLHY